MNVGAVILAAGNLESVRKMLVSCNGKTIIENNLDALDAATIAERVVVLGGEMDEVVEAIRPKLGKIKIALNLAPQLTDLSSLQTGLIVIQNADAALLVPGDEPIQNSEVLTAMVKAMEQNPETLIVTATDKGHLMLFRKNLFGEILSMASDQNLDSVVSAHSDKSVAI